MRILLVAVVLWVSTSLPFQARADSTATCVIVRGPARGLDALTRLVHSELARHPSHHLAEAPGAAGERDSEPRAPESGQAPKASCTERLEVEWLALERESYLTARLGSRMPQRVRVVAGKSDEAVVELLRAVLGSDPSSLEAGRPGDWFGRALFGLRRRAHPLRGLELAQRWVWLDGRALSMPGAALRFRRELDAWQLGLRADVAVWLRGGEAVRHPSLMLAMLAELAWFTPSDAGTAAYAALGLGLEHQRLQAPGVDGAKPERASATGFVFKPRLGLETFRTADTRLDLFIEGSLPTFVTPRSQAWLVSLSVGVGAAF